MGSKTSLLAGELGEIILRESESAERFVDLFAGSGAVAHFVAQRTSLPVLTVDLQEYARILAASVIERTRSLASDPALAKWLERIAEPDASGNKPALSKAEVLRQRVASEASAEGFITRHYGGHYFSLAQAREFDQLYASLPNEEGVRTTALAVLLQAASICAAAPGHTAQPFQPTDSLLPYISQSWSRSVRATSRNVLETIAPLHANQVGEAVTGDAETVAASLTCTDLVFCDPPYSAVQYSRFYHVLEGIARGGWPAVEGKGRAPAQSSRKASAFSMKSKAKSAMRDLLKVLREKDARAIVTFPDADASNGLSGSDIISIADEDWYVDTRYVDSVHSTLGGSNAETGRGGRRTLKEAVILLSPKRSLIPVMPTRPIEVGNASEPQLMVAVGT
ncbi:DNA adenine methylase [Microbacterium betulae]|uniref:site-specific DNA-methyltransferase (adenine-specific) n=1 Tax=Microbacterium betulae TaxID=2981139 RepID=A0AA97FEY8_9MICO|nr:DNA adenine methylase [Microbacterium sp. AB]WOF21908.1 DNA adenine methylase [Microbacterium sp. AB]